jgi:hypothetical protein
MLYLGNYLVVKDKGMIVRVNMETNPIRMAESYWGPYKRTLQLAIQSSLLMHERDS